MLKKRLGIEAFERDWCWNNRLVNYFKVSLTLIIPESVGKIGLDAFCCCRKLKKVVIPKSVKRIEDNAFWGCDKATIILKKPRCEFKFIGECAFKLCKDVKEKIRS